MAAEPCEYEREDCPGQNLWPDDLGDPLIDDDLIRNGLWDREGRGADLVLGDEENWDYQEAEDAWTTHAAAQLAPHGIIWDPGTGKVTLAAGMTPDAAAVIWWDAAAGFSAWIDAVVDEARAGKHLAGPDGIRPVGAPGARWITRAE